MYICTCANDICTTLFISELLRKAYLRSNLSVHQKGTEQDTLKSFADKEEQGERKGREKEESFVLM